MTHTAKYTEGDVVRLKPFAETRQPAEDCEIVGVEIENWGVCYCGLVAASEDGDDGLREFPQDQVERLIKAAGV